MLDRKITLLLKFPFVLFTVILIGSSILSGCAHVENIESSMDTAVSSELPPEAAIQYLSKTLKHSQSTWRNTRQLCRAFTSEGVTTHKGVTVPYTASNLRVVVIRGKLPGSHNISMEVGRCEFTRSCRCYIIGKQNKDEENLIITALHSLGVTDLLVAY